LLKPKLKPNTSANIHFAVSLLLFNEEEIDLLLAKRTIPESIAENFSHNSLSIHPL
jgi:isopentenyldiphosphate isomerase